jgi:hypothetical protein
MSMKHLAAMAAALLILGGCAQSNTVGYTAPERGDADYLKGKNTRADELYLNSSASPGGRDFRDIYIAPANLSKLQIIQPEGVAADAEWQVNDVEEGVLQKAIEDEFSAALAYQSAFNIVASKDQAELVVHTTVVAIHPNANRDQVAAGAKSGGAITVSIALVDAKSGVVLVRSVDTKSTDDIWAFHQVENGDEAVNLIFRSWGNSMRRGILHLQGRSSDPLAAPILTKQQK